MKAVKVAWFRILLVAAFQLLVAAAFLIATLHFFDIEKFLGELFELGEP